MQEPDDRINQILADWSKNERGRNEALLRDAVSDVEKKLRAEYKKQDEYYLNLANKHADAEVWARMPQLAKRRYTPKGHAHADENVGGGADCMFDYLISECWEGEEGEVRLSMTGCPFRIYSTIQGAIDHAETLADDRVFFICGGTYNEEITTPTGMDGTTRWRFFGAGKRRTYIDPTASTSVALTIDDDGGGLYFNDIWFGAGSTGYSVEGNVGNISAFFTDCSFDRKVVADFSNAGFIRCDFDSGYQVESGFTPQTVEFIDCEFSGAMTWADTMDQHYFTACKWTGSAATITNTGAMDTTIFSNCTFDTSGAPKTFFTKNGSSLSGLVFDGCQFMAPSGANGVIYIQSVTGCSGIVVSDNNFTHDATTTYPFITSADSGTQGFCIVGNVFRQAADGDYVEDDGGVSISGQFSDSVFGPNSPPNFDINITGGSNNLYIGTRTAPTGTTGTTVVPGVAGIAHNLLDGAAHADTVASARTRGDLIVGTATGWDDLAINAVNGALLASDGTDVLWRTILTEPITSKTISSDQIAVTQGTDTSHLILTSGENGGANPDDLDGITGGSNGMILLVANVSDSVTITIRHNNAGGSSGAKIFTAGGTDIALDDIQDMVLFVYRAALDSGNGGWMAGIVGGGGGGTNALLDGVSHTDTTNSAVTRGDLIYGNSTPAWDDLALGSEGQFLRASSTDVTWANPEIRGYLTDISDGAAKGMMRFNRATGTMFTTLAITSVVAPTFTHVFTFRKNGSSVGTVSLGAATRATSTVSAFGFAAGDLLTVDHDADSGGHALDEGGELEWAIY